jgi:hypothetical protein
VGDVMKEMIEALDAWPSLLISLLVWGFAPGMVLRVIVKMFRREDPRRKELVAELYAVPRWERPWWVAEQLEVALYEGLLARTRWWYRGLFARTVWWFNAKYRHPSILVYPRSVPAQEEMEHLSPGDYVKVSWRTRGLPAERTWVKITHRVGHRLWGTLEENPKFVFASLGDRIAFSLDHIVEISWAEREEPPSVVA